MSGINWILNGIILNVVSVCVSNMQCVFHRLRSAMWFTASLSCVCGLMNKSLFYIPFCTYWQKQIHTRTGYKKDTSLGSNVKMDASCKDDYQGSFGLFATKLINNFKCYTFDMVFSLPQALRNVDEKTIFSMQKPLILWLFRIENLSSYVVFFLPTAE